MADRTSLEQATGELFGDLWAAYDAQLFEESVQLFVKRLNLAQFDPSWFSGKVCLDAGCGGGRNTIAMASLRARRAVGVDLSEEGLADARRRSRDRPNIEFRYASILDLPFEDGLFDLVWCAGVLMITADEEQAVGELARVLKRGGYLYLLVYATGGIRWPLVQLLRPLAAQVGKPAVERAIEMAGLAPNKRRTFLDDLFCPRLDFFHWDRLLRLLRSHGFTSVQRWEPQCRLDHEANLASYRADLEALLMLFRAGDHEAFGGNRELFRAGKAAVESSVHCVLWFQEAVQRGDMPMDQAMNQVIGQGHHRVLAVKG